MEEIFKTRTLTAAVNKIKPVPTLILDLVFGRKLRQLTDQFTWDVTAQSEKLLKHIKTTEAAQVTNSNGMTTVTAQAPRFAEKRLITAHDLNAIRAFGDMAAPELLKERVGREQADMKRKIDLTREFMAAKALSGQVVDGTGRLLVDYKFSAGQKPVLTGTEKWDTTTGEPLKNIRAWKKKIGQTMGNVNRWIAFCGGDAMDALVSNANIMELLKYSAGQQLAQDGRVAFMAGVEVHEYYGSYMDETNTRCDLIPSTHFILVALADDAFAELSAPVVDFDAESGVGSAKAGELFFSKSWKVEDPSGRWIKVEARPMPVVMRPEAIIYAQVV